jgi:hypothetical protein
MFKLVIILILFFSFSGYVFFFEKNIDRSNENQNLEASYEEDNPDTTKIILAKKELHQAFEKILEKKAGGSRSPAAVDSNKTIQPDDVIDKSSYSIVSDLELEAEFEEMGEIEKKSLIQNLRFEIEQNERLLAQLENDHENGINVVTSEATTIAKDTENMKMRLEAYSAKINISKE